MSRVLSAAVLAATFSTRFPKAGTVDSIEASGDTGGRLDQVEAMGVKNYAAVSGKLQWVRAKEHFFVSSEPVYGPRKDKSGKDIEGDLVQVREEDARGLLSRGLAEEATDDEVAKAQK